MLSYRQYNNRIENGPKHWSMIYWNAPVGMVWHDKSLLAESAIGDYVWDTEPDYPIDAERHLSGRLSRSDAIAHSEYMGSQHDRELERAHASNLTHEDHDNINALVYGGLEHGHSSGSFDINHALWNARKAGLEPPEKIVRPDGDVHLKSIDDTMTRNRFKHGIVSYHGIGFHPAEEMESKSILHLPAYSNGTLNKAIAIRYANANQSVRGLEHAHVLEISHPAGSTGLYVGNNEFEDNELMFPRNITLHLDKEPHIIESGGKRVHVWKAKRLSGME